MVYEWDGSGAAAVLSRSQVRGFDRWAIETLGLPGVVLMEHAAAGCREVILAQFADRCAAGVCIFCGAGNNGGDGFALARLLACAGVPVRAVLCGDAARLRGEAQINYAVAAAMGLPITTAPPDVAEPAAVVATATAGGGLVVDALLGTGLTGPLRGPMAAWVAAINAQGLPIVAVDLPSGMDCDTGQAAGGCIRAAATVTFVAVKQGFAAAPASRQATGRVFVADIGILQTDRRET